MTAFNFDLQRFAEVMVGKSGGDALTVSENKTQVYGLAGNDTLKSNSKSEVLLIGGSGDDVLQMTGGNGTLVGGKGKDTFALNYSATKKISAVIEDIDPTNDKIIITYDGSDAPQLSHSIDGDDVIWTDANGYFNLTLKGSSDASDYYDGTAHEYIWDVLRTVNQERENQNLSPLTLSQGLMDASSIRAAELVKSYSHTRPDGSTCWTAIKKGYWYRGENIAAGQISPEKVMTGWMNSPGHRANILDSNFKKIGIGYCYDTSDDFKYHWVQMFGSTLKEPDTISTSNILRTSITAKKGTIPTDDTPTFNSVIETGNTNIRRGGTYTIAKNFSGTIRINTTDAVTIDATNSGNLKNVQIVTYSSAANLTIKNLKVTNTADGVITFGNGTDNKLTLAGKNVLKTDDAWAAVVNVGGGLTIDGAGSLDVTAGAQGSGIGSKSYGESNANITINNCTINATANMGAGIGSGSSGSIGKITILGGNVTATSTWGSEFGAGWSGTSGEVTKSEIFDETAPEILTVTNSTPSPVTIDSAIKTVNANRRTSAVKITGNDLDNTLLGGSNNDSIYGGAGDDSVLGNAGNDKINGNDGNDTLNGGSGDDTLTGGNGNDLFIFTGGKDIITDYAAGDKISIGAAITESTLDGDNVVLTIGSGKLTINNAKGQLIGMIDSKGKNFSTVVGSSTTLIVTNKTPSPVTFGEEVIIIDATACTNPLKITGNIQNNTIIGGTKNDTLDGGDGNDYISGGGGNDVLSGGIGNDSLTGGDGKDIFIYSAGNDVIADFTAGQDKIQFSNATITSAAVSGSDVVFTLDKGQLTVKNGKDKNITIIDADGNESTKKYSPPKTMTVTKNVTLSSSYQNADASKLTKAVKIVGNSLNNSIKGGSKNDSLYGGNGNDTLSGGKGNDYLNGGNGNDTFIFSAGNDFIADYTAGQDKIKLSNASITSATVSGSDVVFTLDKGQLTVKNGKDKNITIIDAAGNESTKKYPTPKPSPKTLTVTKNATLGSSYQNADASKLTKAVQITGNALNNSIKGGSKNDNLQGKDGDDKLYGNAGNDKLYGQSGNDSLYGGSGNDSLWGGIGDDLLKGGAGNDWLKGGDGNDTFIYIDGDGKDTITGFENGDLLQITGAFSTSYNSSKNEIYFKVGSTAKAITLTDFTATTFHVNNDTYQLSGNKFVKK